MNRSSVMSGGPDRPGPAAAPRPRANRRRRRGEPCGRSQPGRSVERRPRPVTTDCRAPPRPTSPRPGTWARRPLLPPGEPFLPRRDQAGRGNAPRPARASRGVDEPLASVIGRRYHPPARSQSPCDSGSRPLFPEVDMAAPQSPAEPVRPGPVRPGFGAGEFGSDGVVGALRRGDLRARSAATVTHRQRGVGGGEPRHPVSAVAPPGGGRADRRRLERGGRPPSQVVHADGTPAGRS